MEKKESDQERIVRGERIASWTVGTALLLLAVYIISASPSLPEITPEQAILGLSQPWKP